MLVGSIEYLSASLFVLASLYAQEPPWLAAINLLKHWSGLPTQPARPLTGEQEFLSLLLVIALWWLVAYLHRHWDGAKSVRHYEQYERGQRPSLYADSWIFLQRVKHPAELAVYVPAERFHLSALEGAQADLAWHQQARDLLRFSNKSYEFAEDAWHQQARCWIGSHKGTGESVVLACQEHQPEAAALRALFAYASKVRRSQGRDGNGVEYIVALQQGDADSRAEYDGHPVRFVSEARLLDGLVDFSDYFRHLRRRVENDTLTGFTLTLEQMYTVRTLISRFYPRCLDKIEI